MEPVLVYRYRRRPLVRLGHDILAGSLLAAAIFIWPGLENVTSFFGLLTFTFLAFGCYFGFDRHRGRNDRVVLSKDEVSIFRSWRKRKSMRRKDLGVLEPNPSGFGLRTRDPKGYIDISPEIERFEDLRLRLEFPELGTALPPRIAAEWSGNRAYRNPAFFISAVVWLMVAIFTGLLSSPYSLLSLVNLPSLITIAITVCVSLRLFASAAFEKIEILGGQIIWIDCLNRKKVVSPINAILGAHVREGPYSRSGVIDTEYGEIRFSCREKNHMGYVWVEDHTGLVLAAQQVAHDRYAAALANARQAAVSGATSPVVVTTATPAEGIVRS